jgi:hypothetical protein
LRETFEFRISERRAASLSRSDVGKIIGGDVRQLNIRATDPLFDEVGLLDARLRASEGRSFFTYWEIHRNYTAEELESASLFKIYVTTAFEPAGEECGTKYDDSHACDICGAGAEQTSDLFLDLGKMPKKQIARTIADEWVVSEHLAEIFIAAGISGIELKLVHHHGAYQNDPINLRTVPSGRKLIERAEKQRVKLQTRELYIWLNQPDQRELWGRVETEYIARRQDREKNSKKSWPKWYQVRVVSNRLSIAPPTRTGVSPFGNDLEGKYRCPRGDTIGHRFLSEVFVERTSWDGADVMLAKEVIGSRSGLLRPQHAILVTPRFRQVLQKHNVKGVTFEVAHFVEDSH